MGVFVWTCVGLIFIVFAANLGIKAVFQSWLYPWMHITEGYLCKSLFLFREDPTTILLAKDQRKRIVLKIRGAGLSFWGRLLEEEEKEEEDDKGIDSFCVLLAVHFTYWVLLCTFIESVVWKGLKLPHSEPLKWACWCYPLYVYWESTNSDDRRLGL